jgi:hypothetical protein
MTRIEDVNSILGIDDDMSKLNNRNIVFVYCPPKVGSTTLVSSIRLNACAKYTVIHLHNELMLRILYNITDVTVLDIIRYNKSLGKSVIVIDIYRSPIEQKISCFFENIDTLHFNVDSSVLNNVDIQKVISRFNSVFPYLKTPDYFREVYPVSAPEQFDFNSKFIRGESDGVQFYKIRLRDSEQWNTILQRIFGIQILILNDYETDKKPIYPLFRRFKENYRLPVNYLEFVKHDISLSYYYDENERNEYLNNWSQKVSNIESIPFTCEEYDFYNKISVQNQHLSIIQSDHYLDLGCLCNGCSRKRGKILLRLSNGEKVEDRVVHSEAVTEYIKSKVVRVPILIKKPKNNGNAVKRNFNNGFNGR